jgi:hypothetical protein
MSTTATLPTFAQLAEEATTHRRRLLGHMKRWGVRLRADRGDTPTRLVATLDALARPPRERLLAAGGDATPREWAAARADDLWDSCSQAWTLVRVCERANVPGVEHVIAELHEVGRWLKDWPVWCARHDMAMSRLFHGQEVEHGNG